MFQNEKSRKWLFGVIVAVITILAFSLVMIIIDSRKSATLDILVAPSSATIKINDQKYENGTYRFEPTTLSYEISKEGFSTKSGTLELKDGETVKLYMYLIPENGSLDWYLKHEDDQMILNSIGDAEAHRDSTAYLLANPVIQALPIIYANYDENWDYTEFRVDGGTFENCTKDFCLKITDTTGGNYENAVKKIREAGFDPQNYEIIYEYKPIVELER